MGDNGLKYAIIGGGVLAVGWTVRKLYTLNELAKRIIIETSLGIADVQLWPPMLTIKANAVLKNPSQGSIRVNHPTVMLFQSEQDQKANNPFASSNPIPKDYVIPKSGIIKLDPILITVTGEIAAKYALAFFNKQDVKLWVRKYTLAENSIPLVFDEVKVFQEKAKANAS